MALLPPIKYTCFSRLPPPPISPRCSLFISGYWWTLVQTSHVAMEKCDSSNHIRFYNSFEFKSHCERITLYSIEEKKDIGAQRCRSSKEIVSNIHSIILSTAFFHAPILQWKCRFKMGAHNFGCK